MGCAQETRKARRRSVSLPCPAWRARPASSLPVRRPFARNPQWTGRRASKRTCWNRRPSHASGQRGRTYRPAIAQGCRGPRGRRRTLFGHAGEPGKWDKAVDAGHRSTRSDEGADERDLRLRQRRTGARKAGVAQMKSPMREARNRATFPFGEAPNKRLCPFTPHIFVSSRTQLQGVTVHGPFVVEHRRRGAPNSMSPRRYGAAAQRRIQQILHEHLLARIVPRGGDPRKRSRRRRGAFAGRQSTDCNHTSTL